MDDQKNFNSEQPSEQPPKKLYKSRRDKKICGVCGGFAAYFGIDPTVIRLVWAICALFACAGLVAYFVAAIVMPEEPTA